MEKAAQISNDNTSGTRVVTTLSMVKKFHAEGKYWDVQLQIGDKLYKCQRSLLAAISEYFDTMFSSDFKESNYATSDQPIVVQEMDATAFDELLSFLYTGDVCVNDSNVYQLLVMNDFLRLRTAHIKEQCIQHLRSRSEEDKPMLNAFELLSFVCLKAEEVIVDLVSNHICQHWYHYSKDVQLVEISFEHLDALIKFSKNYILRSAGSQNVTLMIIHMWLNHNRKERGRYRRKLMENINFSNVSPNYAGSIIDRLDDVADKVVNLLENTESSALAELETLRMGVEIDLPEDDDACLCKTISFTVENLNKLAMSQLKYSSSKIISNLSWRIGVRRNPNYLEFYLDCEGTTAETSQWKCSASFDLIILSKEEVEDDGIQRSVRHHTFSPSKSDWGFKEFCSWNHLIDPKNGYVNNNSITLLADVYADVPYFCANEE